MDDGTLGSSTQSSAIFSEDLNAPLENGDIPKATSSSSKPTFKASSGAVLPERIAEDGALEIGAMDAPLTLTLYLNYGSRYSREFIDSLLPRLEDDFLADGTLNMRILVLPLRAFPASAVDASALLCAARQQRGRDMQERLFSLSPRTLTSAQTAAASLGLKVADFAKCLISDDTRDLVARTSRDAMAIGAKVVPVYVIGTVQRQGVPKYADLRGQIEEELKKR